jgi:hypothetical protein
MINNELVIQKQIIDTANNTQRIELTLPTMYLGNFLSHKECKVLILIIEKYIDEKTSIQIKI